MIKVASSLISLIVFVPLIHSASQAQRASPQPSPPKTGSATQMRTYVSATGRDGTGCAESQPCRTFQAALAARAPGGEIYVLNSADYGPASINKSVTITSAGAVAGVRATSDVAIQINASPSEAINLHGLNIDGGNRATVGIQFNSGRSLSIQKSSIRGFIQAGLNVSPSAKSALFVLDSTVTQNGKNGVLLSNAATATLSRVTAFANGVGFFAAGSNVNATLFDVVASNNTYGIGASSASVTVRNAIVANNSIGIAADAGAVVRVGGSTITGNGTGWQTSNGGQIQSYSTNNLAGNAADGSATTTLSLR
jgi:hypothetical protein